MRPGRGVIRVRGQHSYAPTIATGTIGTPARFANTAKPFFMSPSWPDAVLVPSGKTITAAPFRSLCITVLIAVIVEALRSIGTAPSAAITRAKGAKVKRLLRARLESRRSVASPSKSGSR